MITGVDKYDVEATVSRAEVEALLSVGPEDVQAADELSFARMSALFATAIDDDPR